ncbi:hypothetical protein AIOGIFDO_01159 [Candidatus Methanoperedenaceae archaeon GB37]|nr:hypothetical protein AIOGIFDO_01159 [Candidatus Methanoperedenaceae archaeon GB37]
MKTILKERDDWRTKEVIKNRFGVEYSLKDVRILITVLIKSCLHASNILKSSGMKYAKPYQRDYRRPENAELHHRILGRNLTSVDRS